MKIKSINSFNYNSTKPSFKHTAVPYPEYESAYYNTPDTLGTKISDLVCKISELFSPKVTKEASEIKENIDNIYSAKNKEISELSPKKQLLSVLA